MSKDVISIPISKEAIPKLQPFDQELDAFLDRFVMEAQKRGIKIDSLHKLVSLNYVDKLSTTDDPAVIAICKRFYTSETSLEGFEIETEFIKWLSIEVSRPAITSFLRSAPTDTAENLKFLILTHEFIHCLFNVLHADKGLMYTSISSTTPWGNDADSVSQILDSTFTREYLEGIPVAN